MANEWERFSKNLANYGVGITEMPAELIKYSGIFMNELGESVGLRNRKEADIANRQIREVSENFKPVKMIAPEYDKWLNQQENNDVMRTLGNIGGGVLGVSGVQAMKALLNESLLRSLVRFGSNPKVAIGAALGKGGIEEAYVEPYLDEK